MGNDILGLVRDVCEGRRGLLNFTVLKAEDLLDDILANPDDWELNVVGDGSLFPVGRGHKPRSAFPKRGTFEYYKSLVDG